MQTPHTRATITKALAFPLVIVAALLAPVHAQPSKKPLLSEVIRATLEKEGADAARKRYQQIAREQKDEYEFDYAALVEHGGALIKAGDVARGAVLIEIAADAASLRAGPAPAPPAAERRAPLRTSRAAEEAAARRRTLEALGPARADLGRFHGVYGDPKAQRTPRNFSVDQTCDGHVRIGAMWGDVAPWVLKSVSDTAFASAWEDPSLPHPLRVTFHTDASGRAAAMSHNILSNEDQLTRLERLGDLPKGYAQDCSPPK
jgi:hypothetical protein